MWTDFSKNLLKSKQKYNIDIEMKNSQKILFVLIILAGGYFAITKGWVIFYSLPFWLISSPLIWYVMQKYFKAKGLTKISNTNNFLYYLYPVAYILVLLCIVGFGDTSRVYAFGFFNVDVNSTLADLSRSIAYISFWVFVALSFYTIYELHIIQNKIKPSPNKNRMFMTVFVIAVLLVLIYIANAVYGHYHQTFYCNGVAVAHGSEPPPNYCR